MTLFPAVLKALEKRGISDLPVFGGGIVPEEDKEALLAGGVNAIFTPGTTTTEIIDWIEANIRPKVEG